MEHWAHSKGTEKENEKRRFRKHTHKEEEEEGGKKYTWWKRWKGPYLTRFTETRVARFAIKSSTEHDGFHSPSTGTTTKRVGDESEDTDDIDLTPTHTTHTHKYTQVCTQHSKTHPYRDTEKSCELAGNETAKPNRNKIGRWTEHKRDRFDESQEVCEREKVEMIVSERIMY